MEGVGAEGSGIFEHPFFFDGGEDGDGACAHEWCATVSGAMGTWSEEVAERNRGAVV